MSRPAVLALSLFAACAARADSWRGKVVGVADGDTIRVLRAGREVKIRLWGVDCPERAQPFGKKARKLTSQAVFGKVVSVEVVTKDRYGRLVAKISWLSRRSGSRHSGRSTDAQPKRYRKQLAHELLRAGLAWWYQRYAPAAQQLARLQQQAQQAKRGLWAEPNPIPPWRWRKRGKRP